MRALWLNQASGLPGLLENLGPESSLWSPRLALDTAGIKQAADILAQPRASL